MNSRSVIAKDTKLPNTFELPVMKLSKLISVSIYLCIGTSIGQIHYQQNFSPALSDEVPTPSLSTNSLLSCYLLIVCEHFHVIDYFRLAGIKLATGMVK